MKNTLENLCLTLIKLNANQLAKSLVILPTQRLATALTAMLAKRFAVLLPPKMLTLEQFLMESASNSELNPCSELTQELILAGILKDKNFIHLKNGHEHELNQFFNDLVEFDLLEIGSEKIVDILKQDTHKDDVHITSLIDRTNEIETLRKIFLETLKKQNSLTQQQYMAYVAKICVGSEICANHSFVFLGCFTTVKEYVKPLFAQIARAQNAFVFLSKAPKLFSHVNPLFELKASLGISNHEATPESPPGKVGIFHCENMISEISAALDLTKKAIAQGVAPSQIAILLTAEAKYSKLLKSLLALEEIESNVATTTSLGQSPLGCFLELLSDILQANLPVEKWQLWLAHPFFCDWIKKNSNIEITLFDWSSFIQKLTGSNNWQKMRATCILDSTFGTPCKLLWNEIEDLLGDGKEKKLLSVWLDDLVRFQNNLRLPGHSEAEENNSLTQAFTDLLHAFRHSLLFINPIYSAKDFFALLLSKMHASEVRSIGYPLKGVQILNLVESRYVPFEVAIILGCIEGQFPKSLPKDHLVDNWIKSQIGLPAWQYVEALEDTTFHLLLDNIPNLFLLYPLELNSEPTVRSRYIEKYLVEHIDSKDIFYQEEFTYDLNLWLKNKSFDTWQEAKGQYSLESKKLFSKTNATELEYLLHCPYKFLLHRLALFQDIAQKHQTAKKQGEAIHQILEAFYSGKYRGKNLLPQLPLSFSLEEFEKEILQRLNHLSAAIFPNWDNSAMAYHLRLYAWPQFAAHLFTVWEKNVQTKKIFAPQKIMHEWKFGKDETNLVYFTIKTEAGTILEVALNGSIDLVEMFNDGYLITDYKRKNLPSPRAVLYGHYPQLLLYNLAVEQNFTVVKNTEDEPKQIIGYYSVLEGKWQARAANRSARAWAKSEKLGIKNVPLLEDIFTNLQNNWQNRIHRHLDQNLPFTPEKGPGCTFCAYKGLCREEDPKRVAT